MIPRSPSAAPRIPARMQPRWRACAHEAGHCLVRWYFGFDTDKAHVLTPDEIDLALKTGTWPTDRGGRPCRGEGGVECYDISSPFEARAIAATLPAAAQAEWEARAEMALIELVAGPLAEAVATKTSRDTCWLLGGQGDWAEIKPIAKAWWPSPADAEAAVALASARATALIRSKAGQRAINAIATTLRRDGVILSDAIRAHCAHAYGGAFVGYSDWFTSWPPTLTQLRRGYIPPRQKRGAS